MIRMDTASVSLSLHHGWKKNHRPKSLNVFHLLKAKFIQDLWRQCLHDLWEITKSRSSGLYTKLGKAIGRELMRFELQSPILKVLGKWMRLSVLTPTMILDLERALWSWEGSDVPNRCGIGVRTSQESPYKIRMSNGVRSINPSWNIFSRFTG